MKTLMADNVVGKITHYFPKIKVAIVKLTNDDIKIGDMVILTAKNGERFKQKIKSMQIEHASIDIAKGGDEFGLETEKEVKANSQVIKA